MQIIFRRCPLYFFFSFTWTYDNLIQDSIRIRFHRENIKKLSTVTFEREKKYIRQRIVDVSNLTNFLIFSSILVGMKDKDPVKNFKDDVQQFFHLD